MKALRDFLLAPTPGQATPPAAAATVQRTARAPAIPLILGVLADPRDAPAVGAAAALLGARAAGSSCALLVLARSADAADADTDPVPLHPATLTTRSGRRLAGSLAARDVPATARGRLVTVTLNAGAAAPAERALAAASAAGATAVVALAGPRTDELDAVLAYADVVLVALRPDGEPVGRLAAAGLAARGVPATVATVDVRSAAGPLTRTGLLVPPHLRAALAPALAEATAESA